MKPIHIALLLLVNLVVAAQASGGKRTASSAQPPAKKPASQEVIAREIEPGARVVQYSDKDIVRLKTKLRYTTMLVLPRNERILEITCGDKEFWIVSGNESFAYVKPAKPGAETNLNLITESGNLYSFVLVEVSEIPEGIPDLKVFVELKDETMISAASAAPKFVSYQAINDWRQQVEIAKQETQRVKEASQDVIDKSVSQFISNVRFPYRFEAGKKPFFVRAMYHDDKFTFIQARPEETPALYEFKDGQPNLVNFQYKNGVYVVEKILDRGNLAIGKQRLNFRRQE
jgi:hypothetical protein